jgi:hypothetical protein
MRGESQRVLRPRSVTVRVNLAGLEGCQLSVGDDIGKNKMRRYKSRCRRENTRAVIGGDAVAVLIVQWLCIQAVAHRVFSFSTAAMLL